MSDANGSMGHQSAALDFEPNAAALNRVQPGTIDSRSSLIYCPENYFILLTLAELFPGNRPLEVELGSGDGSFLVQYAKAVPGHNFLGVERLLGRLRKIDRKGRRAGLTNLRAIRIEAGYFLEYMLPQESTQALHVYFPDPWPKRKHWPNRLVNARFTELARRVLVPGGVVYLRTDDCNYFAQMKTVFESSLSFTEVATPLFLGQTVTDFEREFNRRGIQTLCAAFQRR